MDLFEMAADRGSSGRPLADFMRPKRFDEFVGQAGALAPLVPLIHAGELPSLILWGPPGCGKTTLALLLAETTRAYFISRNAVDTGAKILRDIGLESHRRKIENQQKSVLFIDEIHRLNKSQQDVLLPHIEVGDFTLIGATTENPSYELNPALLSRCRLVVFERLKDEDLQQLLARAFLYLDAKMDSVILPDAQAAMIQMANGDARRLLNSLEHIFQLFQAEQSEFHFPLAASNLEPILGNAPLYYDKDRDEHFDTISAFIKSIRGSDPDAALYYLARMLKAGEDPLFIARRLVILASEDVGNADPRGIMVAMAGAQAVEFVGLPEAAINLAHVVTYLASAPKSNKSYLGLRAAQAEVDSSGQLPIPVALRSSRRSEMKKLGYGRDYRYSHDGAKGWIDQEFLPEKLKGKKFYEPSTNGYEKSIVQFLAWLKGERS